MQRAWLPIFLIVFVDILGLTIILPLLPFYTVSLGASPFVVGMLISSYGVCQLISGPFLGQLSDRIGRKPVLLVSQFGTLAGFVLLALSKSLVLVFLARIIDGLTAGNITVAQAYLSDVTEKKDRTRAFGIIGASFGLGFLIGPALSGVLAKYGNQYPIWAAAALSLTSIVATMSLLKWGKPPNHDASAAAAARKGFLHFIKYFRDPNLAPWLWQFFAFAGSFSLFVSGLALFCAARFTTSDGKPFQAQQVGYLFAYSGLIGLVIQAGLIRWLSRVFGEQRLIIFGFLSMSIGYIATGQSYTIPILLLSVTFNSMGSSVLRPTITSMASQNAHPSQQGAVMGVLQSLQSLAQIAAPLISGFLIDRQWYTGWSVASATCAAVGFVILGWRSFVRPKPKVA
jgi:multidrug resistance protein